MSLAARLTGLCTAPQSAMRAASDLSLVKVLTTWAVLLFLWAAAGAWLIRTPVGRQALVDERVRAVEAFGGEVDDATYAAWQAHPPYWVYLTSGGRTLLAPPVTLAVALGMYRWLSPRAGFTASLSVAVHATAALVAQQLVATPFHWLRESLTSPFTLAGILPLFDEGTFAARLFGTVELFGLWWVLLLAAGCAALTGRRARTFAGPLLGVYGGAAAVGGGAVALAGGT